VRQGDDLAAHLAGHRLLAEECIHWGPATRLLVRAYACETLPPLALVTSVRCLVFRDDTVLALVRDAGDREEAHIVPGGRREPGETVEGTLRREVLEETGWEIGVLRLLGCVLYRHMTRRPSGYPYPYPEFAHLIYTAEVGAHRPQAMEPDEVDGEASFMPMATAREMPISAWQRAFLDLATAGGR
jgi:ADP-ribose pyrophosphatase YjhB (NUDIX family)